MRRKLRQFCHFLNTAISSKSVFYLVFFNTKRPLDYYTRMNLCTVRHQHIASTARKQSNSVVFTNDGAIAASLAVAPVLRRFEFFEPVELADFLESLVYKLPGTLAFGADFAAVFA
jgi:hypothetical protein